MPRRRASNNIIDMRPGKSGDPFLEVARKLAGNEKLRKQQRPSKRFNNPIDPSVQSELDSLLKQLTIPRMNPLLSFGYPLSQVQNPFEIANQQFKPWEEEGLNIRPSSDVMPARIGPAKWFDAKPAQKSLTGKKKGRLNKQPEVWRVQ